MTYLQLLIKLENEFNIFTEAFKINAARRYKLTGFILEERFTSLSGDSLNVNIAYPKRHICSIALFYSVNVDIDYKFTEFIIKIGRLLEETYPGIQYNWNISLKESDYHFVFLDAATEKKNIHLIKVFVERLYHHQVRREILRAEIKRIRTRVIFRKEITKEALQAIKIKVLKDILSFLEQLEIITKDWEIKGVL
jgi:hypothetical protein